MALRRRLHREGPKDEGLRLFINAVQTTKFFSTPDSSGKPFCEAKSLERIAGKGSEKNYFVNRSITGGVTPVDEKPPSWKRFCMVT